MSNSVNIPDVILVKKKYNRANNTKRHWKLKHMEKDVDMMVQSTKNQVNYEQQYEEFLRDIEEDKDLRKNINLYKDEEVLKELEGKFKNLKVEDKNDSEIDIKVDELLDELTLNDRKESIDAVPHGDQGNDDDDNFESPNQVDKKGKDKISNTNNKEKEAKQIGKRERTGKKIEDN